MVSTNITQIKPTYTCVINFTTPDISHLGAVSIQLQVKVPMPLFRLLLLPGTVYGGPYSFVILAMRVVLPCVVTVDITIWFLKSK
jgi:hypothetical protein